MISLEDEFGDIIQKARTGLGMTVGQVAGSTGIPAADIERMEAYQLTPADEQVRRIAATLELDATKLLDIAFTRWAPEQPAAETWSRVIEVRGAIGDYEVKGYLLFDQGSGQAVLIDTANNAEKVLAVLKDKWLGLKAILLTHCHRDHIGGLKEIKKASAAGVHVHIFDLPVLGGFKDTYSWDVANDRRVEDGQELSIGPFQIRVLFTPGHTPGGVCYLSGDVCFVGDSIFAGSLGRTRNTKGYNALREAVRTKLLTLPDHVRLFPGHGPSTTVGEEKRHNPFFLGDIV